MFSLYVLKIIDPYSKCNWNIDPYFYCYVLMGKMNIRRNPTKHQVYTHIMIDSSCLLLQPICESLSAAFLFMTNPRFFKQKRISKCRVQMTHKLLTCFTAMHCMMLGRSILVHAHCCVLILQPWYEWFCRRTFPNQICYISIIKPVHKIYQI